MISKRKDDKKAKKVINLSTAQVLSREEKALMQKGLSNLIYKSENNISVLN